MNEGGLTAALVYFWASFGCPRGIVGDTNQDNKRWKAERRSSVIRVRRMPLPTKSGTLSSRAGQLCRAGDAAATSAAGGDHVAIGRARYQTLVEGPHLIGT